MRNNISKKTHMRFEQTRNRNQISKDEPTWDSNPHHLSLQGIKRKTKRNPFSDQTQLNPETTISSKQINPDKFTNENKR